MMKYLMETDAGARCVDTVALESGAESPAKSMKSLGSRNYTESMTRLPATECIDNVNDSRDARRLTGTVPFRSEAQVPDVGGMGWRTKSGHLLKNQGYYSQLSNVNKWDLPAHAGINTWKAYHGPKMKTDAETMARLDQFDADQDLWSSKKMFVNTTRAQQLDRFYGQKQARQQLQAAAGWAPHKHPRREVHSSYETFDSCLDEKPIKELRKILTAKVLKGDRDACRAIASRIQNEETWKETWKLMECERRDDIRADLQARQVQTDRLMYDSGQPVRTHVHSKSAPSLNLSSSARGDELSRHRDAPMLKEITHHTDFHGLVHADNPQTLEALYPGGGHEFMVKFQKNVTESVKPGWPPPPRAETPRIRRVRRQPQPQPGGPQDSTDASEGRMRSTMSSLGIPMASPRLENIGGRISGAMIAEHAQAQFLSTVSPPAPSQRKSLLMEDWSPHTTLVDSHRLSGGLMRTDVTMNGSCGSGGKHIPPPVRSVIFPTLAPSAPVDRLPRNDSAPTIVGVKRQGPSARSSKSKACGRAKSQTVDLCRDIDDFEALVSASAVKGVVNFFYTPRATGSRAAGGSDSDTCAGRVSGADG